jgi:hypothetical protein
MWTKATELNGNIVWLNLALARSIVRLAYEGPKGKYGAKTVVVFDAAEQWTVVERPEVLLSFAGARQDDTPSDRTGKAETRAKRSRTGDNPSD